MKRFFKDNWIYILGGIGIVTLYFVRLYHLTLLPIFADEAIYLRWSQIMGNEPTLRFLPLSDGKTPLFMWALMFVINRVTDPLFIGRLLSVFTGFGTLIGIGVISYLVFKSKQIAFIAAFIYSISPFTFFFDRLALVDSMFCMFGVWTFIFAYLTVKTKRSDMAMLMGFSLGFAWLTKSSATIYLILLPTTWLFNDWKKNVKVNIPAVFKLLLLFLTSAGIAFAMFNILRLGSGFNLIASRNQDYIYPLNHIFTSPFDPFKGHIGGIKNYFYLMGPVGLIFLWILGYFANFKKYWKEFTVLSAWATFPLIVTAEYFKVVTARYVLYIVPFIIIISAASFLNKNRVLKILTYLALAIFIVQAVLFDFKLLTNVDSAPLPSGERTGYLTEWTAGQGIKEISEFIKTEHNKNPKTKIVVGTEGYFGTLPDGLQIYTQGIDNVVVIGIGLGIDKVPEPLVESRRTGNKTYLVVNRSRLLLDPIENGLTLIASYQKPLRNTKSQEYKNFGPQDALLFFEVK